MSKLSLKELNSKKILLEKLASIKYSLISTSFRAWI